MAELSQQDASAAPAPAQRELSPAARLFFGVLLCVATLACGVLTVRTGAAEVFSDHGKYRLAVASRPDVSFYRRELAESEITLSPRESRQQLLIALRLNPYDPIARADLATADLALARPAAAVDFSFDALRHVHDFDSHWRYANLLLLSGQVGPRFWGQVKQASVYAAPDLFPSIVTRTLTATNFDFHDLIPALPADSAAAAAAVLIAATDHEDWTVARQGVEWVLRTRNTMPSDRLRREDALQHTVQKGLAPAPGLALQTWNAAVRTGLLSGRERAVTGNLVEDGSFQQPLPTQQPVPNLGGWNQLQNAALVHPVVVAAGQPALELTFDGTAGSSQLFLRQWVAAPAPATYCLSVQARSLGGAAQSGMELQVNDFSDGQLLQRVPIATPGDWQTTQQCGLSVAAKSGNFGALSLTLAYERVAGTVPLQNPVLLRDVRLWRQP